jgi:hypothetical protein
LFSDNIGNPSFIAADTQKAATTSGMISLINFQDFDDKVKEIQLHVLTDIGF